MKYLAIVEALEADIKSGRVSPGERLPSQRAIAEALNVDLTTVTRAFNEGRRRGLIKAHAGRGTFINETLVGGKVPGDPEPLIDLSMNIPPQPNAARLKEIIPQGIAGILGSARGMLTLHYQPSTGIDVDRRAAAHWLSQRIDAVGSDRIVVTGGAQSALFGICDLLLSRGDVILSGEMTYPGLKAVAAHRGIALEPLAMDGQGLIPDDLDRACREKSPRALYLIPAIDNPTTTTMPEDRRRAVAAIARKYGLIIIEDDPYSPLQADRKVAIAELAGDITWHIATLSKCATPALRVAYVVAPDGNHALRLAGVLRSTLLMAPPLMSALATRWITDGTLNEVVKAIRVENVERQQLAAGMLGDAQYAADPHGHHLWLRLPAHWSAANFAEQAERAGISVVPSSAFAVAAHPVEAVRISLGVAPSQGALEDGLTQLAALLSRPSLPTRAVV